MPFLTILLLSALLAGDAFATPPTQLADPDYVGVETCASCHQEAFEAWQGSHHDLAMQEPTPDTVLGNFNDTTFTYGGVTSRFYRRGEDFMVSTDGPDGKLTDYRVEYVFGADPLQQYLLTLAGGRLQALSISWDSRPASTGGQRWFHLYPDESVDFRDPLHWTGVYQNWNTRCAECHSNNLQKNFDAQSASFSTTWTEINVTCEACHGPGKKHLELARKGELDQLPNSGFPMDLAERGQWLFPEGADIAQRTEPLGTSQQVDTCGRCHARRGTLGDYEHGKPLLDTHRLSLIEPLLYHQDGQIQDEVYVHGSFVQSKMYGAGVVCSNCHEPHSMALRAQDNGVCAQCHKPDVFDTPQHHQHPEDSAGSLCANCHMPETTYMVVDPRRDHSMRIPRPDLSVVMGIPNACNMCHTDESAEWAVEALRKQGVAFTDTGEHPARAFEQSWRGDGRALPRLQDIAMDPDTSAIVRASALAELGNFPSRESYDTALRLLESPDPMLRLGAVRGLNFVPPQQLLKVLAKHLQDPSAAVRMEIARALAQIDLTQTDPASAARVQALFEEYLQTLSLHEDMPGIQLQRGTFFAARGNAADALQAYQRALKLNPQFLPALLNEADLYRAMGQENEARISLERAVAIAPEQPAPLHALGLLETRAGNSAQALAYLRKAAELEQEGIRNRYVYAIALHDSGQIDAALDVLRKLHRLAPDNPELLLALTSYSANAGKREQALRYAEKLLALAPDNPDYKQLYNRLKTR